MMPATIRVLLHLVVLLALPPLVMGVINKTKAALAGRRGPPVLQLYWDLARLLQKGLVQSTTTTALFRLGPLVTLGATLLAGLFVPLGAGAAPLGFTGDLVLFAGLLALGRLATTLAALDTGSAFEGMGVARELTFAVFAEPAVLFVFLALTQLAGLGSLSTLLHDGPAQALAVAPLLLCAVGLFVVLLAEGSRIPFDDPNTHLELTMVHEVMVLDHSGPPLAAILAGAAMKLTLLASIVIALVLPTASFDAVPWVGFGAHVLAILLMGVVIGLVESTMARLRMKHAPSLLVAALLLCAFGFLLSVRAQP